MKLFDETEAVLVSEEGLTPDERRDYVGLYEIHSLGQLSSIEESAEHGTDTVSRQALVQTGSLKKVNTMMIDIFFIFLIGFGLAMLFVLACILALRVFVFVM